MMSWVKWMIASLFISYTRLVKHKAHGVSELVHVYSWWYPRAI